ncbi:ribose 5-phosphate isomerase B [Wenyingzhuangia sp. 2_MG-2023]|uniref:ribose 5-phosphate isomerase B n=1 Tax=Wenyingzhuangia sp. 2_MG-2023 TaxID=3062639 RepID=UPI0026E2E94D|nr:ribose 5-phosphate isomerase B [Wenyingzhuangia sp. 2_MG-2023]MDO6736674.1 ribose 5-phosphate isomerase B [Wenyingzhuangia sp. 2_MG-2023]
MKIAIGNDHAGPDYKLAIVKLLKDKGIEVVNHGTDAFDSVDYPDHAHKVAKDVDTNVVDFGILICGSANGVAMTANKYQNVRAGLCWTKEIVSLVRQHNNANVLCIPARFTAVQQALEMVETFLNTDFEGGRHQNRVSKIACS